LSIISGDRWIWLNWSSLAAGADDIFYFPLGLANAGTVDVDGPIKDAVIKEIVIQGQSADLQWRGVALNFLDGSQVNYMGVLSTRIGYTMTNQYGFVHLTCNVQVQDLSNVAIDIHNGHGADPRYFDIGIRFEPIR